MRIELCVKFLLSIIYTEKAIGISILLSNYTEYFFTDTTLRQ